MLRCIRFGEVLLDESFRTFLICNQCQTEFVEVPEFRLHLATSSCGQRLFKEDVIGLKFGAAQVTRSGKEKTYLLYNPADVQLATTDPVNSTTATSPDGADDAYLDLMKIEEELLNPRWYTDIASTQSDVDSPQHTASLPASGSTNKPLEYKELVEAVGPYVQFKEIATKKKPIGVVVRRFQNKANNPTAAVKNPVVPVKSQETITGQPATRLLNPAAKRKLDMPHKQVQFSDTVNVKYVINEKTCLKATANKFPTTQNSEKNEKTEAAAPKRRKTITLPMDQTCIHPDLQEQFGKRNSDLSKTTVVRNTALRNTAGTTATKLASKPNSVACVVAAADSKALPAAKGLPTTSALQSGVQAHIKNLVPNPLVIQKQINGTKKPATNSNVVVKNPINSSGVKSELKAVNTVLSASARPQQRIVHSKATATTTAAQPALFAAAKQLAPPALAPLSSNKISNTAAIAITKAVVNAHQQTNDILNKLQTRGLQVKRTHLPSAMPANTIIAGQHSKTMELLQKLQSKGMKVKILNGAKQTACTAGATVTHVNASINLPTTAPNSKICRTVGNVATAIEKQTNKTILNNKLIIKKVK